MYYGDCNLDTLLLNDLENLRFFNRLCCVHNLPLGFSCSRADALTAVYHMFKQQVPYGVRAPRRPRGPEIMHCSVTHIITQGPQITGRQMDPDGCLDRVSDGLPET